MKRIALITFICLFSTIALMFVSPICGVASVIASVLFMASFVGLMILTGASCDDIFSNLDIMKWSEGYRED